jgi:hypothetical protein
MQRGVAIRTVSNCVLENEQYTQTLGIVNYKDNKAKCRHLKKLTCKTAQQTFLPCCKIKQKRK